LPICCKTTTLFSELKKPKYQFNRLRIVISIIFIWCNSWIDMFLEEVTLVQV
jgi:hypothetical protein